jgi:hypothetical protein
MIEARFQFKELPMFRSLLVMCLAAMLAVCLASCTGPVTTLRPTATADVPQEKLLEVTRAFLKENHPDWVQETYALPCTISDAGTCWQVSFELPQNPAGDGPVLFIAKTDMFIWAVFHDS